MNEFDLISRYFKDSQNSQQNASLAGVLLDKGDDCAMLVPTSGKAQVITTDTLVAGVHFLADMPPYQLAYRALATNLSDLAAMGAKPKWFSLALTLTDANTQANWLSEFSAGLFNLADQHGIYLTGGDTTSGPLSITITAIGEVEAELALKRSGAQIGDSVYVSGELGDAAAALDYLLEKRPYQQTCQQDHLLSRFNYPTPQIALGQALTSLANSALDISDGLVADLGHICRASNVNAQLYVEQLPLSDAILTEFPLVDARAKALSGGDDYQLCFTVPEINIPAVKQLAKRLDIKLTEVGVITAPGGILKPEQTTTAKTEQVVQCLLQGKTFELKQTGYQHFSS